MDLLSKYYWGIDDKWMSKLNFGALKYSARHCQSNSALCFLEGLNDSTKKLLSSTSSIIIFLPLHAFRRFLRFPKIFLPRTSLSVLSITILHIFLLCCCRCIFSPLWLASSLSSLWRQQHFFVRSSFFPTHTARERINR